MKEQIKDGIAIAIVVAIVAIGVYFLTAIFMTGEIGSKKENNSNNEVKNISTRENKFDNMILASRTFDIEKQEYMVLFYHSKDIKEDLSSKVTSYSGDKTLYEVDLDEVINKKVISSEANINATSAENLKINDVTLITISNKKIISYVVGNEDVVSNLK